MAALKDDKKQPPTLQTIADISGLSRSSVSRALRDDPRMSKDTRKRVHKIAEDIGYRVNPLVSALMSQLQTRNPQPNYRQLEFAVVKVFTPNIENSKANIIAAVNRGFKKQAEFYDYGMTEFVLGQEGYSAKRIESILDSRNIRGIIFQAGHLFLESIDFNFDKYACVFNGYNIKEPNLDRSVRDYLGDMHRALNNLNQRGYRRVGFFTSNSLTIRNRSQWDAGFQTHQLQHASDGIIPILTLEKDFNQYQHVPHEFVQWFKRHQPDALLTCSNITYRWLQEMGVNIPQDTAYVNMVGSETSKLNDTHLSFDWKRVGAAAVDLLIERLNANHRGVPVEPKLKLIPGEWVEGDTCRPL